jgi:hypothetical protein
MGILQRADPCALPPFSTLPLCGGEMRASWLLGLALLAKCAHAYPDMAGSCEGVFSGAHVRLRHLGRKRGDGGWSFEVGVRPLRVRARPATAGASATYAARARAPPAQLRCGASLRNAPCSRSCRGVRGKRV